MPIELRAPGEDEFVAFMSPVWRGFGHPTADDEHIADERDVWEPDRSVGALDGDDWVGGTGAYGFDLTLPGGDCTPVAGVTMVGVLATHRRQGILTRLMARQLDDVAARGEVAAVLTASETNIYGRFGYGWAASTATVEIETARSAFRAPAEAPGRLRAVHVDDALDPLCEAYDRCRSRRAGTVSRSRAVWEVDLRDRERHREGASARHIVVHESPDGSPDGLVTFRVRFDWPDQLPHNMIEVEDLCGADDEIEAALWRHVLDVDLAATVRVEFRPVDDPIRWRLAEPRRLRTRKVVDLLWVRLLDVPRALSLRSYEASGSMVLEVVDQFRPASGGRFRLDAGPDGAQCAPTSESPDLVLGVEELGAVYLGGLAPSALAAARRIDELTPGALRQADAIFPTALAPFNGTMF